MNRFVGAVIRRRPRPLVRAAPILYASPLYVTPSKKNIGTFIGPEHSYGFRGKTCAGDMRSDAQADLQRRTTSIDLVRHIILSLNKMDERHLKVDLHRGPYTCQRWRRTLPTCLQQANGPARPVGYRTLAEYRCEMAASAVAFRSASEDYGGPLPAPADILFPSKSFSGPTLPIRYPTVS
ncbi:hypothetical protein EVAR_96894_1 [Eumeta japonica]|uniref:Uncharacterized protein n=1 Tax=Eumeta variegata TaxID=151549 RepID=A0A4C1WCY7_EUMVA|nr:hypothetical protein EVAR_96894_1 [Eumeta japonica]